MPEDYQVCFSTFKSTSGLPGNLVVFSEYNVMMIHIQMSMINDHVPHHQTATEAHDGQHLGPPRHLHHVRHGAQSLPREVPRFKPRPSGWISIEMAIIDSAPI